MPDSEPTGQHPEHEVIHALTDETADELAREAYYLPHDEPELHAKLLEFGIDISAEYYGRTTILLAYEDEVLEFWLDQAAKVYEVSSVVTASRRERLTQGIKNVGNRLRGEPTESATLVLGTIPEHHGRKILDTIAEFRDELKNV